VKGLRITFSTIIACCFLAGSVSSVAAQEAASSQQPLTLAALCEANAPDAATLATCLDVVGTVLDPSGDSVRVVTVPTSEEFMADLTAILPAQKSVDAGTLLGQQASSERTKPLTKKQQRKAAKQELAAARGYTDTTREYLLSVTPDPCYANMYASAWGVATALQQWADKASTQPAPLLFNTYSQFVESPQAISCEELVTAE